MSSWYAALYLAARWQGGAEKEGEVPECVHLGRGSLTRSSAAGQEDCFLFIDWLSNSLSHPSP